LKKKLLQNPLSFLNFNKANVTIITQDTNYKQILELPITIFKSLDSYITIDKMKVEDNYINNSDYFITFGDYNERYNINGSGEIIINKIIDKFTNGLNVAIKVFNVPNTTGTYQTALLIYYSFNGAQYILRTTVNYAVVLPKVLDNEYLLVAVERLDYNPPLYSSTNSYGMAVTARSMTTTFANYLDVMLGTPGCNLSLPDFL